MKTIEPETAAHTVPLQQLTLAEYMALPEGTHQLINGTIIQEPAPTPYHQDALGGIFEIMRRFVREGQAGKVYCAPIDVVMGDGEVYQPDIVFISNAASNIIGSRNINGAPTLVVEIISPSTGMYDWQHKRFVYAEHGVAEYWIVDPQEQSVDVMRNQSGMFVPICSVRRSGEAWSEVIAGFRVELDKIFEKEVR